MGDEAWERTAYERLGTSAEESYRSRGKTCGVESVSQGLFDEEAARNDAADGGAFAEDDEYGGDDCDRAVDEGKNGGLWQIGEDEHENGHSDGGSDGWHSFLRQRLPEFPVRYEVPDPLVASGKGIAGRDYALSMGINMRGS